MFFPALSRTTQILIGERFSGFTAQTESPAQRGYCAGLSVGIIQLSH
jgi:hypothetical protein